MLASEHFSSAAESTDHFIGDQQGADFISKRAQLFQKIRRRNNVSRCPLNRFNNNCRNISRRFIVNLLPDKINAGKFTIGICRVERTMTTVRVRCLVRSRRKRTELMFEIAAQQSEHADGFPVKTSPKSDEFRFLRVRFCETERSFNGLRSAAVILCPFQLADRDACKKLRKLRTHF